MECVAAKEEVREDKRQDRSVEGGRSMKTATRSWRFADIPKAKSNEPSKPVENEPSAAEKEAIAAIEGFGGRIRKSRWGGDGVEVTFKGDSSINNEGLVHLKELTDLVEVYFLGTKVTDAGLVHLQGLTNLRGVTFGHAKITNMGLVHLKGLTKLERLTLGSTEVTDAGLVHLQGLTKLNTLSLFYCKVTDAGVKALQAELPNCKIRR